jgi:hypothetical protein
MTRVPLRRSNRQFRVRRSSLVLVTTLLGLAVLPPPQTPASASCAGPYLKDTERLVLQRGSTVTIEGRSFTDGGCQDSMSCSGGLGCGSCEYVDPPPTPMQDVGLRLVQRDRTWDLGVADAKTAESNQLGWVTWTFDLPAGAQPGPAKLVPEHAEPVRIQIR